MEPSVLAVQHQIRANAAHLQEYVSDLYAWEESIEKSKPTPAKRKPAAVRRAPTPRTPQRMAVELTASEQLPDQGEAEDTKGKESETSTTRQALERAEGNAHYQRGDFVAAIQSYTRCLACDPQNAVVLSNRAMAFLKNREYRRAEEDCTQALRMDPQHVKSLLRRATARNALGKHRLALLDLEQACALDPRNKQGKTQLAATKDSIRTAIKRAPVRKEFAIRVEGEVAPKSAPETPVALPASVEKRASKLAVKKTIEELPQDFESSVAKQQEKENAVPGVISNRSDAEAIQPLGLKQRTKQSAAAASSSSLRQERIHPKTPKKAPTTAYEFTRVWKELTPKGDAVRIHELQLQRIALLHMVEPATLPTLFKNSIESDLLCEMFDTLTQALDQASSRSFAMDLVKHFARIPRFSMTLMFLTDKEKQSILRVFEHLLQDTDESSTEHAELLQLRRTYDV